MNHYCVIGCPVKHSLSPEIHNAAFKALNIDAVFEKFEIPPDGLEEFMTDFRKNFKGCNVTIPHKETVMRFLDEIDEEAKKIGAVNAIRNDNGRLTGFNTDFYGAIRALKEVVAITGKKVCILGAGGASRAVLYGILKEGGIPVVLNRTIERAKNLAEEFNVDSGNLDGFNPQKFDILINTTSCGMYPNDKESPIDLLSYHFKRSEESQNLLVMDIIYLPQKTKLIKTAQSLGCKTITGDKMFLYQAVKAFEIWTKQKAPIELMEKVLNDALQERDKLFPT